MSTKSTISINYVDRAGKKGQKSITDINPQASGEQLQEFAEKLNALTTNVYGNTNRVDKTPITNAEEPPAPPSTTPTIVCYQSSGYTKATTNDGVTPTATVQQVQNSDTNMKVILKTDTDARPYFVSQPEGGAAELVKCTNAEMTEIDFIKGVATWRSDLSYGVFVLPRGTNAGLPGDYVIGFPATENFKAATYTFTITA